MCYLVDWNQVNQTIGKHVNTKTFCKTNQKTNLSKYKFAFYYMWQWHIFYWSKQLICHSLLKNGNHVMSLLFLLWQSHTKINYFLCFHLYCCVFSLVLLVYCAIYERKSAEKVCNKTEIQIVLRLIMSM